MLIYVLFFSNLAVMLAICGAGLWLGDRPVRLASALVGLGWIVSLIVQKRHELANPQYGILAVDIVCLCLLVGLAVAFRRNWLYAAGGAQMLAVTTHFAYLVDKRIDVNTYLTAEYVWAYLLLATLVWGISHTLRERGLARAQPRA